MKDYCSTCMYDYLRGVTGSRCASCTSNDNDDSIVPSAYIPKENTKIEDYIKADVETTQNLHEKTLEYLMKNGSKPEFKYKDIPKLVFKPNYNGKMPPERFQELLDELDGNSLQTLKEKNARYSSNGDSLHNFRSGAEVAGGTPAQVCWGYMTKHLVALRDMVMKNDFSNREDFLEKCQDTINYVRFLWCIGNDASNSENNK